MNRPCVLFVSSRKVKNGITALGGALGREGLTDRVEISHLRLPFDPTIVAGLLGRHPWLLVAFSFCTADLPAVAVALDGLLSLIPAVDRQRLTLLAGGPHPSGAPEGTLRLGFDLAAVGEGEETLTRLVGRLLDGECFDDLPGLASLRQGEIVMAGRAPPVEIEAWPPFCQATGRYGPIEISRGCPHACAFCQTSALHGGRMRHRSPSTVAAWAEQGRRRGMRDLRFVTPDAFSYGTDGSRSDPASIERLLREVGRVFPRERIWFGWFPSEVRPEMVSRETVELVAGLAGNKGIVIGAQSGSRAMLDRLGRGHTPDDVLRAVRIVAGAGLVPCVDFIFGLPGEDDFDRESSLTAARRIVAAGGVIHSHWFMPLPGTRLATAPPGRVEAGLREELGRLAGAGRQFGQWELQRLRHGDD